MNIINKKNREFLKMSQTEWDEVQEVINKTRKDDIPITEKRTISYKDLKNYTDYIDNKILLLENDLKKTKDRLSDLQNNKEMLKGKFPEFFK
jgi:cobalamin-dependent methionine synthase I